MGKARRATIAGILVLAAAAPSAQAQTTRAEYVDKAEAVCKSSASQTKRTLKKVKPSGNPVLDLVKRSALFGKFLGKTAGRLESIEPPAADESEIENWISGIRRQKRLIERAVRAFRRDQANRARAFAERSQRVGAATRKKARKLGIDCAGDGS